MLLNSKVYDVLKWFAQYLLPALGTLYFALSGIWGLPYGEEVVGTLMAVTTFLGVILGISSVEYKKQQAEANTLHFDGTPYMDAEKVTEELQNLQIRKGVLRGENMTIDLDEGTIQSTTDYDKGKMFIDKEE